MLTKAREKEITDEERDELVTLCIIRVKKRRQDSRSNINRYRCVECLGIHHRF